MGRMAVPALMMLAFTSPSWGQTSKGAWDLTASKTDLDSIKADLQSVKSQLAQVVELLKQRSPGQIGVGTSGPVRTSVADGPTLGRADAPVTLVEFSDYQCPFCQKFSTTTLPVLKKDYIETGKVRYVFRDFPLEMHREARKAAEAAHCAGEQGKYWEMHDVLFENQRALASRQLLEHAARLSLSRAKFAECLSSGRHALRIEKGLIDGASAGVHGTPGFVVGKTKAGDVVEGTPIRGAQPPETFRRIINQLLAEHGRPQDAGRSKVSTQPGHLPE